MSYDELIQFNKFAELHNDNDIIFCKTDYVENLFNYIRKANHNTPAAIITGNSDIAITDDLIEKAPPCISMWFTMCANTQNPIVHGLPFGIDNHEDCFLDPKMGKGHSKTIEKLEYLCNPLLTKPKNKVYANFSLETHDSRLEIYNMCKNLEFVTCDISDSHIGHNNKSYESYIEKILDHEMVVCPRGNAPADTHRFWETLYMNRVPVVKKNMGNRYFLELPVVVLEDWNQLEDVDFLMKEHHRVKNNSRQMLRMSYWKNYILSTWERKKERLRFIDRSFKKTNSGK